MSPLIRSVLVAAALIGTASAVSAAPHEADPYAYSDTFNSGVIADFNKLTHKGD